MAENLGSHDANDSPWSHIDATHLTGDLYYVEKYSAFWWIASALTTLMVPPVGAFCIAWMVFQGIERKQDEIEIELT